MNQGSMISEWLRWNELKPGDAELSTCSAFTELIACPRTVSHALLHGSHLCISAYPKKGPATQNC